MYPWTQVIWPNKWSNSQPLQVGKHPDPLLISFTPMKHTIKLYHLKVVLSNPNSFVVCRNVNSSWEAVVMDDGQWVIEGRGQYYLRSLWKDITFKYWGEELQTFGGRLWPKVNFDGNHFYLSSCWGRVTAVKRYMMIQMPNAVTKSCDLSGRGVSNIQLTPGLLSVTEIITSTS